MEFLRLPLHFKTTPQGGAIHFSRITLSETPGPKAFKKAEGGGGGGILDQRPKGSHAPYCLLPRMPRVFGPEDDTVLQV